MFDIGFWELVMVGIVVLLVVGPERLPGLAHDAGMWLGKIRQFINHTKREIESELSITESKEFHQQLSDLDDLLRDAPDRDQKSPDNGNKSGSMDQDRKS